jgi:hypothetical protein
MIPTRCSRLRRALLPLLAMTAAGCASWFNDQIDVPGTNQRILVGHDGWPNKKAWVLVDGTLHPLTIQEPKEQKQ